MAFVFRIAPDLGCRGLKKFWHRKVLREFPGELPLALRMIVLAFGVRPSRARDPEAFALGLVFQPLGASGVAAFLFLGVRVILGMRLSPKTSVEQVWRRSHGMTLSKSSSSSYGLAETVAREILAHG